MINLSGTPKRVPSWLAAQIEPDVNTRIEMQWESHGWCEVVKPTPTETWLALCTHPKSSFSHTGQGFHATASQNDTWCSITSSNKHWLGLFVACWKALRLERATELQRQELLDAERELVAAQKRHQAACAAVPGEVVRAVLNREIQSDE